MAKKIAEERKADRTGRHVGRIREIVGNSPGEKVDAAVLRHRADQMETDYGDDSLHDALDQTEREISRHNKAVLRNSDAPQENSGATRTMRDSRLGSGPASNPLAPAGRRPRRSRRGF